MKKSNFTSKMSLLLVMMLVAALALGCGSKTDNTSNGSGNVTESETSYEKIGEGSTGFIFEVTDSAKETVGYEVSTDETTVGAALLALELIGGENSDYGLYVTTVLGNEPTCDADGTPYWAFYINGEYAPTGVDATEITPGATYSFVVETY